MALAQGRFSRGQRIRKRSEFRSILNSGVRVPTSHCVFVVASRIQSACESVPSRLGLVVSRKVGGSVLRNRFKRLAREVFRKCQTQLPRGTEIVLIARSWSRELPEAAMAEEWATARPRIISAHRRHLQKSSRKPSVEAEGHAC